MAWNERIPISIWIIDFSCLYIIEELRKGGGRAGSFPGWKYSKEGKEAAASQLL